MIPTGVEPRAGGEPSAPQPPLVSAFFLRRRFLFGQLRPNLFQFRQTLCGELLRRLRPLHGRGTVLPPAIARGPTLRRKLTRLFKLGLHHVMFVLPLIPAKAKRTRQNPIGTPIAAARASNLGNTSL